MSFRKITDHAWQLTRLGFMNCYLVLEDDDTFTLIDTTVKGYAPKIMAAAKSLGAPIRRIALTHAHGDHVGSSDALMAALGPGAQLAASERSLPLLRKPADRSLRPGEPAGKIRGGTPGIAAVPTHLLTHGELFGSLRVIDTPGHIPGHQSFLDERDGTLFAGDAIICKGRVAVSGYAPWYFPLPNFATWNKATALASARQLLEYPIERFASGHGAVRGGGRAALEKAIARAS